MGYMRHHAIVVTSWNDETVYKAHQDVKHLADSVVTSFGEDQVWADLVSPVVSSIINGGGSFFIGPDGSKEGWDTSDNGDVFREKVVEYLKSQEYEDGSSPLDWAEIQYGDEDGDNKILRSDAS